MLDFMRLTLKCLALIVLSFITALENHIIDLGPKIFTAMEIKT